MITNGLSLKKNGFTRKKRKTMSELISFGASFKRIIRFIWLVTINYVHIHWPMWFKDNSIIGLSTSVTQFPYGHFSLWFFSYRFVMNSSVCSNIESQFDQTESQLYSDQNEISLAGHCKFGFDSFFFFLTKYEVKRIGAKSSKCLHFYNECSYYFVRPSTLITWLCAVFLFCF